MDIMALPHSMEAEAEVLGSIISNNDSLTEVIDILKPGDFYNSGNKLIYSTILDMFQKGIPIDIVLLSNTLGKDKLQSVGGVSYLSELVSSNITSINIKQHATLIKEKSDRRLIIKAAKEALEEAYGENEVKSIIGTLEDKLLDVGVEKANRIITDEELMELTINSIQANLEKGGDITGMSTGYKTLDSAINGLSRGDVVVIAGRPSMGKTCFALNIGSNMAEKYKVAIFELEMSPEKLGARRLAAGAKINANKLTKGRLFDEEWIRATNKASKIASKNNMFTDTSSSLNTSEIRAKSKKIKLRHGLDLIIIDHIGLVSPNNPKDIRVNQVAEITRSAKILAKDLDVAVVLLSQLSRACETRIDKRPILSDLRESGSIEQDADLIMFMYRDEYYNKDSDEKNILECIIAKQRDGKVGTLKFAYLADYQLVGELELVNKINKW